MDEISGSKNAAEYIPGTLQNLRVNGTLPYTRVGGVIYYDYEDIQNMIISHKVHS